MKTAGATAAVVVAVSVDPVGAGRPANALVVLVSGEPIPGTTTEDSGSGAAAATLDEAGAAPAAGVSGRGIAAAFCL